MKQMHGGEEGKQIEDLKIKDVQEHLKNLSKNSEIEISNMKLKPIKITNGKTKPCKLKLKKQKEESNLKILRGKVKQGGGDKLNGRSLEDMYGYFAVLGIVVLCGDNFFKLLYNSVYYCVYTIVFSAYSLTKNVGTKTHSVVESYGINLSENVIVKYVTKFKNTYFSFIFGEKEPDVPPGLFDRIKKRLPYDFIISLVRSTDFYSLFNNSIHSLAYSVLLSVIQENLTERTMSYFKEKISPPQNVNNAIVELKMYENKGNDEKLKKSIKLLVHKIEKLEKKINMKIKDHKSRSKKKSKTKRQSKMTSSKSRKKTMKNKKP